MRDARCSEVIGRIGLESVEGVEASSSKRCGMAVRRRWMRELARSAIVSVTAQKAGGDSVQPMGSANGKAVGGIRNLLIKGT
eukprot:scaffold11739_cov107-Cylindrotheca_fusiformis.AAC.1